MAVPAGQNQGARVRLVAWAMLLLLVASRATAIELRLESVTEKRDGREFKLRVDSRARFDFDPDKGQLKAAGTWIAQNVVGPNQSSRYSHKVEDLQFSADGKLSAKSYECVEGTFGAEYLGTNICGSYQFGPNGLDDGGLVDDVVLGPPKSLDAFRVGALNWDGKVLVVTLNSDDTAGADAAFANTLTLRFSAEGPAASSRQ